MQELVIFDCDGVLVDSEVISFRHFLPLLKQKGFSIELEEAFFRFVGKSDKTACDEITQETGIEFSSECIQEMQTAINEGLRHTVQATNGITELLQHLEAKNTARCVASSSHPERIRTSLTTACLIHFFETPHIFSAQQVKRGKPAPDLFLLAAEKMGYAPHQCLVIEDSVYGIEAAQSAGMRVVGYTGATHAQYPWYRKRLEPYGIPVIEDFKAVLNYLN